MHQKDIDDALVIAGLINKYFEGTLTEEEKIMLQRWRDEGNEVVFSRLLDKNYVNERLSKISEIDASHYIPIIYEKIQSKKIKKINFLYRLAACMLMLIISSVLISRYLKLSVDQIAKNSNLNSGLKKSVVLKLGNGKSILLDNRTTKIIERQNNTEVLVSNGTLSYRGHKINPKAGTKILYDTIHTPPGTQYKLLLSDGTRVWINASTTLIFPESFIGNSRNVAISGEAYFEVKKDKAKPFTVLSKKVSITVLGTKFNVNSFDDEAFSSTTLLEGKVQLKSDRSSAILLPGQQGSTLSRQTNIINVKSVNVDQYVSWTKHSFTFNQTSLNKILLTISKWYGIKVIYESDQPEDFETITFSGKISMDNSLDKVIGLLQEDGRVQLSLHNDQLIVKKLNK